jgi:PleD family two-component response regulator
MRILVVDDCDDSRNLIEAALLSAGYGNVLASPSAWEALKVLDIGSTSADRPAIDLVLLDIVMPEMDGTEACARIRSDSRYADLPIIMLTSLEDGDALAKAFGAGATDYIRKPVVRVELIARVRAAIRLKAELDRRQERERELLHFLSKWGDRRATLWIDEATGLFVGEVAEAYLTATDGQQDDQLMSIVALSLDRFDVYRSSHGEHASKSILAEVARAVRGLAATIGIVAAAYRNGTIVLIAPELDASSARKLGETLWSTVSKLRLQSSGSIGADHVTASVAAITGQMKRNIDPVHLLTEALSKVGDVAATGGNRVLALTV